MRNVYIQKSSSGNSFFSENCFIAAVGFSQMGYNVVGFINASELNITKQDLVVGGINSMREVFNKLNIKQPKIDNPHSILPNYIGRKIVELQFSEVEEYSQIENVFPFFIKPLEDHKLFTGYVIKSKNDIIHAKIRAKPESKIILSECVDFITEYRCFVLEGNLIGCKNYTGDFRVIPDFDIIENAIKDYKDQPVAYSIDFGVTKNGETLLIEMNDAFGLSAYGFNKVLYCKMLQMRWDEIMNF